MAVLLPPRLSFARIAPRHSNTVGMLALIQWLWRHTVIGFDTVRLQVVSSGRPSIDGWHESSSCDPCGPQSGEEGFW
jgi:hypothetical protein